MTEQNEQKPMEERIFWMNSVGVLSEVEPETYGLVDMENWIILRVDEYDADTNERKVERRLFHVHKEGEKRWISLKTLSGNIDNPTKCPLCKEEPDNFETFYDLWAIGQD